MGAKLLLSSLLVLALAALIFAVVGWNTAATDEPLSGHILIAFALGSILSLAVGIGLMSLVFYSSRQASMIACRGQGARRRKGPPNEFPQKSKRRLCHEGGYPIVLSRGYQTGDAPNEVLRYCLRRLAHRDGNFKVH